MKQNKWCKHKQGEDGSSENILQHLFDFR